MNHFTRLIDLTSADEKYIADLATTIAPCILRPRTQTSMTMEEKHAYRLTRDLFANKEAIFSELKRMSTLTHSTSVSGAAANNPRPRAISTDESNRKAHVEERNRALLEKASGSRSRATSPAPSPRGTGAGAGGPAAAGHRRDRSIGGPETRFPIQTSPTATADRHRQSMGPILGVKRQSLEVPGAETTAHGGPDGNVNGGGGAATADPAPAKLDGVEGLVEKRNSLGKSAARFVGGRRVAPPSSLAESNAAGHASHGVTLVDAPMDD